MHDELTVVTYAVIGGARRQEESTWAAGKTVHLITLHFEDEDVTISSIKQPTITGAQMLSLSSAAMLTDTDNNILVFGGLDTTYMESTNEVFKFCPLTSADKYNCQIWKDKDNSRLVLRCDNMQSGDVPTPRFGHTLTRIGNTNMAVLFWGMNMNQRETEKLGATFSHVCRDDAAYILDMKTLNWTKVAGEKTQPRAFHQAVYLQHKHCIVLLGGVVYEGREPRCRLSLSDTTVLQIQNNTVASASTLNLVGPPLHVSFTSACVTSGCIFMQGGYQQRTGTMLRNQEASTTLICIDVEKMLYQTVEPDVHFKTTTVGHSALALDNECILFMGGSYEGIFAYTSKSFTPGACDLGEACTIGSSPEVSPIAWIQCEGACKKWIHQFCANVMVVPRGQWKCEQCRLPQRRRPRKKTTK